MPSRQRSLHALLGATLGLATGVTLSCEQGDFVTEYAAEVCRMVRDCGIELHLPKQTETLPATSECEVVVETYYLACDAGCQLDRAKARRCLRRLRDNECDPETGTISGEVQRDEAIPQVCSEVYEVCNGGNNQETQCSAPSGCSVGGRPGDDAVLMLGFLVLGVGRHRRWYRDHR
jgi:hypothetical protein